MYTLCHVTHTSNEQSARRAAGPSLDVHVFALIQWRAKFDRTGSSICQVHHQRYSTEALRFRVRRGETSRRSFPPLTVDLKGWKNAPREDLSRTLPCGRFESPWKAPHPQTECSQLLRATKLALSCTPAVGCHTELPWQCRGSSSLELIGQGSHDPAR